MVLKIVSQYALSEQEKTNIENVIGLIVELKEEQTVSNFLFHCSGVDLDDLCEDLNSILYWHKKNLEI